MSTVMFFYAGMALIIALIFFIGMRVEKKNAWRREEQESPILDDDRLDPGKL